jgi:phosphatidylglycerophosphate synthase
VIGNVGLDYKGRTVTDEQAAPGWAWWADALTAGRAALALPLAMAAATDAWVMVAVVLSVAWVSDFADGRLARRAIGVTRLGRWDLPADTTVGAGVLAGLVIGGHISVWIGVTGLVLGAGYLAWGNPALSMLLQAGGYGPALWFIARDNVAAFVLVVGTIVMIAAFSIRRLFGYVLPTFFNGLRGRIESPKGRRKA